MRELRRQWIGRDLVLPPAPLLPMMKSPIAISSPLSCAYGVYNIAVNHSRQHLVFHKMTEGRVSFSTAKRNLHVACMYLSYISVSGSRGHRSGAPHPIFRPLPLSGTFRV